MSRRLKAHQTDGEPIVTPEQRENAEGDLPASLAKPAQRALASAGYTRLEQLAGKREAEIKQLHGMGPKAIEQIRRAMAEKGLAFAAEKSRKER